MSQAGWVIAWIVGGITVAFILAWSGRRWWVRRARSALVTLVGRRDAVRSALRSLRELMGRLIDADQEVWVSFSEDPKSEERHALDELRHRMEVLADELTTTPLPKAAHGVADALADVARELHGGTARVGEARSPEAAVTALVEIDIAGMVETFEWAESGLDRLLDEFGVVEASVYGGGLYI